MSPFEIRLELLKMAKDMLGDDYYGKREVISNDWSTNIDSIQDAKITFLKQTVQEDSLKKPLIDFLEAQRVFTKQIAKSANDIIAGRAAKHAGQTPPEHPGYPAHRHQTNFDQEVI
jgi:hypothetical protein